MSSSSSETEVEGKGGEQGDIGRAGNSEDDGEQPRRRGRRRSSISEMLEEELAAGVSPEPVGNGVHGKGYKIIDTAEGHFDDGSQDGTPPRNGSPVDSMLSIPDDTPSIQVRTLGCL